MNDPSTTVRRMTHGRGFTLFEVLIVVVVMAALTGLGLPYTVKAIHRGRVNEAANAIVITAEEARQMALRRKGLERQIAGGSGRIIPFGVSIVPADHNAGTRAYAVLTGWRTGAGSAVELGERRLFNRNVDVMDPAGPATATSIVFAFGTGFPGTPGGSDGVIVSPNRQTVTVGTLDAKFDASAAVWISGMTNMVTIYPYIGAPNAE